MIKSFFDKIIATVAVRVFNPLAFVVLAIVFDDQDSGPCRRGQGPGAH